ncbi:hypothetical protein EPUL_001523 [Erysiphe pulchra]|uniref:Uncharacterized protein n=1 Tax=Erysiphe pulchra TaxID=225359 RepID=A0A2S4PZG5_9PEZI|nr:hypothetical protein EPUL_001523 [Erysiphe pulchra]
MASIIRHRKRPPQEEPPPAESVSPNPSYSQLQQEVTLTAALDRGAATRKTTRISREKTVLSVAKALDDILPDVKKNCQDPAKLFEKVLLTAIEDLAAALNEALGDPTCVKVAYATSSGVAIVAGNDTKAHKILQAKDQLNVVFSATEIERQESWITFLVQPVPKRLHSIFGNGLQIDENALAEGTERAH